MPIYNGEWWIPVFSSKAYSSEESHVKVCRDWGFYLFSQIQSQFQKEKCWPSSDSATCSDSPHRGTSPSLPQFPGLKDQQVTSQLGKVSVIWGFGLQAELESWGADKVIGVALSLVEPKLAGAF